ncbi:MAG: sulfate adenylyltransferase subunit CysN [Nitrosomonas sp.]|nr:MAG: sulfate adenylyltransferase subunit CysN [Nitrosomonas sp.]
MVHVSDLIAEDIELYLKTHEKKGLLRFITCGSVDDGKSTLIGRMLYESKMLFEDQLMQLEADSKKVGTQAGDLDFALLVDGLAAEREQGITIDVAYRFFSTDKRKFIVADTPGHEQYTRNMITGASTADVAIILIDARKGVLTQTRRHSYLVSLIGIRHVVLAINKLDMVGYSEAIYHQIDTDYRNFANEIGLQDIVTIPMSALKGDNITALSENTLWYQGETLMGYLESVQVENDLLAPGVFRMPVQWVNRPNLDFRGYSGLVVRGSVKPGDAVRVLPSGKESRVSRIVTSDGDLEQAIAGQSITLTLTDEIDISRGDVLARVESPPKVANRFEATIVWMADEPMLTNRPYLMKVGAKTITAHITSIQYKVNINTLEHIDVSKLELNEIGICSLGADQVIAFDPYDEDRDTGGFILIDRLTNNTIGAGMLRSALDRGQDAQWQVIEINKRALAAIKGQTPLVLWFVASPASNVAVIVQLLERRLYALGKHTSLLSDQDIRLGLNQDLSDSESDQKESIRRIAKVAKLMINSGQIVLVSVNSPLFVRDDLAAQFESDELFEILIDLPQETIKHSVINIETSKQTAEQAVEQIIDRLSKAGVLK